MADALLQRNDAPFGQKVWESIDTAVRDAAQGQMKARRLLSSIGPFGLGCFSVPLHESVIAEEGGDDGQVSIGRNQPLPLISSSFELSARDIDSFQQYGFPINLQPAVAAARWCAMKEDKLLFYGSSTAGVVGLLHSDRVQSMRLKAWKNTGVAVQDITQAIVKLDTAGFHGPYTLALSSQLYVSLFKPYPLTGFLEIQHLRELVTDGVIKAPSLEHGGVLVAAGSQFASIVLGQDLITAYEGPSGRNYRFVVSESVGLRLMVPPAVCRLDEGE